MSCRYVPREYPTIFFSLVGEWHDYSMVVTNGPFIETVRSRCQWDSLYSKKAICLESYRIWQLPAAAAAHIGVLWTGRSWNLAQCKPKPSTPDTTDCDLRPPHRGSSLPFIVVSLRRWRWLFRFPAMEMNVVMILLANTCNTTARTTPVLKFQNNVTTGYYSACKGIVYSCIPYFAPSFEIEHMAVNLLSSRRVSSSFWRSNLNLKWWREILKLKSCRPRLVA
jgi:hypothetical protein